MTRQAKRRSILWSLFLFILTGGLNAQESAVNPLWETAVECIICLAYQVGPYRLLGYGKMPKSTLVRKLESGNRDIYADFVKYCHYKGKKIPSIERRKKSTNVCSYPECSASREASCSSRLALYNVRFRRMDRG